MNYTAEILTLPCPLCQEAIFIEVFTGDVKRWREGAFVQKAFPYLTPEIRERLISGYCSECWDKVFSSEED